MSRDSKADYRPPVRFGGRCIHSHSLACHGKDADGVDPMSSAVPGPEVPALLRQISANHGHLHSIARWGGLTDTTPAVRSPGEIPLSYNGLSK